MNQESNESREKKWLYDLNRNTLTDKFQVTSYDYPTHRIAHFVNRSDSLAEIAAIHEKPNKPAYEKVAVLSGLGGCGKTQLALHYCQQSELNGRFSAIYWIDANSSTSLFQSFASIAKCLGKRDAESADNDGNLRFSLEILSRLAFPWLLVFDNFDDPEQFQGDMKRFFPKGNCGSILVTSRLRSVTSLGQSVGLSFMTENGSLELLFHKNKHLKNDDARAIALEVVRTLSYHALAISQARGYIESCQMDLEAFLEDYKEKKEAVLRETRRLWEYRKRLKNDAEHETCLSVLTTWELSFSQISGATDIKKAKQHVLTLAGFFHRDGILEAFFRTFQNETTTWRKMFTTNGVWDSQTFQTTLKELYNLSLVQGLRIPKSGAEFALHPLIQE